MAAQPVVSILCTTYNHGAYVGEALEGFLAQRGPYPFEVVVHDDASTDGTADVVRAYAARHPDIIRPILQTENQYSKERGRVTRIIRAAARGEFIAYCEGDDKWTDPDKLRAQVDHLRAHPEQPLCFTNAWNEYPDGARQDYLRAWLGGHVPRGTVELRDIVARNFIPTASTLYRRAILEAMPEDTRRLTAWDWLLVTAMATHGPLGYLDRITCVRRVHEGGAISMKPHLEKIDVNLQLLDQVDVISGHRCMDITNARRVELCGMAVQHAVDNGRASAGAPFLRRLVRTAALRDQTGTRDLMRWWILVRAPWLGRWIHRLRR